MSELRYHPFLDTWVITATHRQDRTFHPPDDYCPLCPTAPGGFPTEIPTPEYDIAIVENRFPSLAPVPPAPAVLAGPMSAVRPSAGVCEVVCYSSDHTATFATLPLAQIRKLARVWKHRYVELAARPEVEYVFIFENKGKEIGVTLSHPHGQIYAYPFIPPVPRQELDRERAHHGATGGVLVQDWLHAELLEGTRVVWRNASFAAVVPFFARYPYEVYVAPLKHLRSLAEMGPGELDDLAEALHVVARKLDGLFGFSMPYIMVLHQAPTVDGYDFACFHAEFYPPYRTATKLKYLAGSEAGAGAFINDTLAESSAEALRQVPV